MLSFSHLITCTSLDICLYISYNITSSFIYLNIYHYISLYCTISFIYPIIVHYIIHIFHHIIHLFRYISIYLIMYNIIIYISHYTSLYHLYIWSYHSNISIYINISHYISLSVSYVSLFISLYRSHMYFILYHYIIHSYIPSYWYILIGLCQEITSSSQLAMKWNLERIFATLQSMRKSINKSRNTHLPIHNSLRVCWCVCVCVMTWSGVGVTPTTFAWWLLLLLLLRLPLPLRLFIHSSHLSEWNDSWSKKEWLSVAGTRHRAAQRCDEAYAASWHWKCRARFACQDPKERERETDRGMGEWGDLAADAWLDSWTSQLLLIDLWTRCGACARSWRHKRHAKPTCSYQRLYCSARDPPQSEAITTQWWNPNTHNSSGDRYKDT